MTSISFLQNCPADRVTLELVQDLVAQGLPEGISLEYKEKYSTGVIETIAAFANTHGGLIIVGIDDDPLPNRVKGVPESELAKISNSCTEYLDPPFVPEIISLRLPGNDPKFLLLIRVYPEKSTRPVGIRGKIHIRLLGNNDGADHYRLLQLFTGGTTPPLAINSFLPPPNIMSETPAPDLLIRTGFTFPVNLDSSGRSFSEKAVTALIDFLNQSPLSGKLAGRNANMSGASNPFHKEGLNRARNIRLYWYGNHQQQGQTMHPVECIINLDSISNGITPPTTMTVTIDYILRQSAYLIAHDSVQFSPTTVYPLSIADLYEDLEALVATTIDPEFKKSIAQIANVEVHQIPRPMSVHILFPHGATETLRINGLRAIPGAGTSQGASLVGDSSLDLANRDDFTLQIDQWVTQLALDGGLEGIEDLLETYHQAHP